MWESNGSLTRRSFRGPRQIDTNISDDDAAMQRAVGTAQKIHEFHKAAILSRILWR
jgi:hypothetical protein